MSEIAIAIAHKLYEARRVLRRLMGESYAKHAAKWMEIVDAVAEGENETHLRTSMKLIQDLREKGDSGMSQMWLLAAAVELMEPDEQTPDHRALSDAK